MSHSVNQQAFEGPLDLLLDLVSRDRLDVTEVSICLITEEYLCAIKALEPVDLDAASSFLVLAATLLELKSLRLLPSKSTYDPELALLLEERDHLVHRLIEYSTFRQAAGQIERMLAENSGFYPRTVPVPEEFRSAPRDELSGITAAKLAGAAAGVFFPKSPPSVDVSHVSPIKISVREMVDLLAEEIQRTGRSTFRSLCDGSSARLQIIVRFLALLEMFKDRSVDLEQAKPFDEIVVRWTPLTAEPSQ